MSIMQLPQAPPSWQRTQPPQLLARCSLQTSIAGCMVLGASRLMQHTHAGMHADKLWVNCMPSTNSGVQHSGRI